MAQVILSMKVHCDRCAKKIRKAAMKVPGAESVTTSFETGLVVVEGSADATALRERLQALTKRKVNIVSDGAEDNGEAAAAADGSAAAEDDGEAAAADGSAAAEDDGEAAAAADGSAAAEDHVEAAAATVDGSATAEDHVEVAATAGGSATSPATAIVLEMNLHCQDCADKVGRRIREMPGVDAVTTDVSARRVMVIGTADASALATRLQVSTGKPVRVVSDPQRPDAPQEPSPPTPTRAELRRRLRRLRVEGHEAPPAPAPSPPAPSSEYSATSAGYLYPEQPGGVYGGQHWAAYPPPVPEPQPEGYYPYGRQQWPAYQPPALEGSYPYGGQQWPAYQPTAHEPEPEGHYSYDGQQWPAYSSSAQEPASEGHYPHDGQHDQNPSNCSVQ